MRYRSWVAVLLLKALTAVDPEAICQLSDCSALHSPEEETHPQRHQLCSNKGSHLFDLFYEPSKTECSFVSVFLDLVDHHLDFFMNVVCGNFTVDTSFPFAANNLWTERCVHMYGIALKLTKTCGYHQSEQIRFTIIDNGTLLVEDLSLLMPPGTRIIFRVATGNSSQEDLAKCQCQNVHQDVWSYKQCGRYTQGLSDSLGEFLICLGIVLGMVLIVFVALWWATRVRDYKVIELA
ncbi:hypothetical protein quinque_005016 [Culex quinquefasciatus]